MPRSDRPEDPRGLIQEAYRIDGISAEDCRTIFFDWAVGVPDGQDALDHIKGLHAHYGTLHPDHPMTGVLTEGLSTLAKPRRRRKQR